jgi:hypothetical protein
VHCGNLKPRSYWKELTDSIVWAHKKLKVASGYTAQDRAFCVHYIGVLSYFESHRDAGFLV